MDRRGPGGRERRVLLLTPFPPDEDGSHGGARSTARLIKALAPSNRIALACLRATDEAPLDEKVATHCEFAIEGRRPGSLRSSILPLAKAIGTLRRFAHGTPLWVAGRYDGDFASEVHALIDKWQPHVVQAEFSAMGQYIDWRADRAPATVVTFHEPGVTFAEEWISRSGITRPFWKAEYRRWQAFEKALLRRIGAAVTFTHSDATILKGMEPASNIEVIPLGIEMTDAHPQTKAVQGSHSLVFVGNLVHPPNLDAAQWLVRDILPLIRQRSSGVELLIVGPGSPAEFGAADGVTATGVVPDVTPYLQNASVVLAPLRQGGGMRVKVLEAMAAGKAIVATKLAMEGISITPGRDAMVANNAREFAEAVLRLLSDDALRATLGANARKLAEHDHSMQSMAQRYDRLYDTLLADLPQLEPETQARIATEERW